LHLIERGYMKSRLLPRIVCPMAVLLFAFSACSPKETKALLLPGSALGAVLAEETIRAAGTKKNIAVITHDANWGPTTTVEETFQAALKKQGFSVVTAKSANLGDPMRSGEVGLKAADFFEALEKSSDAGAIVSFAGAPLLRPGDAARVPAEHPPVLVVSTAMLGNLPGVPVEPMQLGRLLDARVIQLAIVDGSEPAAPKADATHELFAQHYRKLRRPD
jgi:hypothetical protein